MEEVIRKVMARIEIDFGYTKEDLKKYRFVCVEEEGIGLYWDNRGIYVLDEDNKVVYYQ